MDTSGSDIPVLIKRSLQAQVIGPIYAEMVAQIGEEKANAILDAAIRKAATVEGKHFAQRDAGRTSLASLAKLYELWTRNGSLEIDVLRADDEAYDFNVTRCRYAETYKDMGLGKIGRFLSCNRDGTFIEGYDPNITLERKQTIMEGAPCCTFRYRYKKPAG